MQKRNGKVQTACAGSLHLAAGPGYARRLRQCRAGFRQPPRQVLLAVRPCGQVGSWAERDGIPGVDRSQPPTRSRAGRTGVGSLEAIPEAVESGQHIRAQAAADRSNLSKTSADG
jgi:hypothetical protein